MIVYFISGEGNPNKSCDNFAIHAMLSITEQMITTRRDAQDGVAGGVCFTMFFIKNIINEILQMTVAISTENIKYGLLINEIID
jgi:hypothetical protein